MTNPTKYQKGTNPLASNTVTPGPDGDGLPNRWEERNGLDPENPDDAGADNDGDGVSNTGEFTAATDPNVDENASGDDDDATVEVPAGGGGGGSCFVDASASGTAGIAMLLTAAGFIMLFRFVRDFFSQGK